MKYLLFVFFAFLFSACSFQAPKATSQSSMSNFNHAGIAAGCVSCHGPGTRFDAFPKTGHKDIGTKDCNACHVTTSWNTASPHQDPLSPPPTSCTSCHSQLAGYTAIQNTITNQMLHTMPNVVALDCATCHSAAAQASGWMNWTVENTPNGNYTARTTSGVFHTTGGTPTSCTSCHANEVPTPGQAFPNTKDGFDHAGKYGTECATCHTVVAANTGKSWSKGYFNHNGNNAASFTNCSPCHDTKQHHAGTDCTTCHDANSGFRWPASSATGSFGGAWGSP